MPISSALFNSHSHAMRSELRLTEVRFTVCMFVSWEPMAGRDCVFFTFIYWGMKLLACSVIECVSMWTEVRQ